MSSFTDLKLKWKILVVIGIIALFISITLAIILILIFETDLIPIESLINTNKNLDKFDYLFDDVLEKETFIDDLEDIHKSITTPDIDDEESDFDLL